MTSVSPTPSRRQPCCGRDHDRDGEAGQVAVLVAVLLLGLLALLGLVADGGLVFTARRDLQGAADGAARAGAGALDQATYRASNGQVVRLDPAQARSAASRFLDTTGFSGDAVVTADPATVTVTLAEQVRPPILGAFGVGPVEVDARAAAHPETGITVPEAPSP